MAPCSVTEFKNAALEYICLNLEGMLENQLVDSWNWQQATLTRRHSLLDELEDDLMLELDEVVRQNQLACLPISKSGRAEDDLLERHPELIALMERSKRAKVDSMALRSHLHEDEAKFSSANKTRSNLAYSDEGEPHLSSPGKARGSPSLKAKASVADLMFVMDEDAGTMICQGSTESRPSNSKGKEPEDFDLGPPHTPPSSLHRENIWFDSKGKAIPSGVSPYAGHDSSISASHSPYPSNLGKSIVGSLPREGAVWRSTALTTPKLDMRDIMAQASLNQKSNISSALSQGSSSSKPVAGPKLSQKERKRQLQQQQLSADALPSSPEIAPQKSAPQPEPGSSPWRIASAAPRINLKDVLSKPVNSPSPSPVSEKQRSSFNPGLTLRQTVAGSASGSKSPSNNQTKIPSNPTQMRSTSSPIIPQPKTPASAPTPSRPHPLASTTSTPIIQSIRHNPSAGAVEPTISLSIADILSQQQTEKDLIREAVAKRSLQEIQEEQAFAEWWDAESRKVQEEEAAAAASAAKSGRGRSGGGSRGGRGKGRGGGGGNSSSGGRGRGKGRRSGGGGGGESSAARGGKGTASAGGGQETA